MYSHPENNVHASAALTALSRLRQDYLRLKRDPVPFISAEPLPRLMLEWHFVVEGPNDSPYNGGFYHGKLLFPKEFPFKPPAIIMQTPNGRFETNRRLCLSISDFHPESWNPSWSVSTILTGLLSFMLENSRTIGSIDSTLNQKRRYARESLEYNLKNHVFTELFPEIVSRIRTQLEADNIELPINPDGQSSDPNPNWKKYICTNFCIVVGVAVVVYTVRSLY